MPNYKYSAIDKSGKLVKGTAAAIGEESLENRLENDGLTLIKAKQVKSNISGFFLKKNNVKPRILIEFYHRLSQAMNLGLPLMSALDENARSLPSARLKDVVGEVRVAVESGNTLYEAMSRYHKIFGKLDLGIVRMGELAGVLPKCMSDLADFLEWKEDIRSTLKRAAMYPVFMMVVIVAVIGVWVGYVLPQMAAVLIEMGVKLPGITETVLGLSGFVRANWLFLIGLIFESLAVSIFYCKTVNGKIRFHKYLLKVPLIGTVIANSVFAQLSHNFATMYRSGMKITDIFDILSNNVLGNRYVEKRLKIVFQYIQEGHQIAEGFEMVNIFPPLLLGAIRSGEITGTLDDSFKRLGDYYDGEVKRTVQAMINAVEPATIIFLGAVFGVIVLSILLPLYDVIGSFGSAY
ncbi:MAG: type II secretion system F family protein [Deltaproteobacteria bacterium]|nr:type II secretion system F family protein [Deltaproteobacteria bacterium]